LCILEHQVNLRFTYDNYIRIEKDLKVDAQKADDSDYITFSDVVVIDEATAKSLFGTNLL